MSNTDFLFHQGRSIYSRCHPPQNHSLCVKHFTFVSQKRNFQQSFIFFDKNPEKSKNPENGTKGKMIYSQYQVSKRQQTRSVGRRMHVCACACPSLRDRVSVVKVNHARAVHPRGITYRLNHPGHPALTPGHHTLTPSHNATHNRLFNHDNNKKAFQ